MTTRIHFVTLFDRSPWGGCEELWSQSALWLQQHGNTVSASIPWWPKTAKPRPVEELIRSGGKVTHWRTRGWYFRSWLTQGLNRIAGRLNRGHPFQPIDYHVASADLIVFSNGDNRFPIGPIRVCRQRGWKYVLIIHSVNESSWPGDIELDDWRYIYEGAEAVFFVSNANRESTVFQLGFNSERFHVAVNPFGVAWDTPFVWPDNGARLEWAFVGRLAPAHKGLDLLLRAFARDRWKSRAVHLNLYGNGLSENSMKRMTKMLDLDARVSFWGHVSDIEGIWRKNELLILPSRHEGLPLVVVDAMLYGRPCLVTNVSGNPEYVDDEVTGFLAEGPTVDAVDAALERAWQGRARLREMGESAYARIRQRIPRNPTEVFALQLKKLVADDSRHQVPAASGENRPVWSQAVLARAKQKP